MSFFDFFIKFPFVTKYITLILLSLYLLSWISLQPQKYCLIPSTILSFSSLHTLITSSLIHITLFHLIFNLSTFLNLGLDFEYKWGSLKLLFNIISFGLAGNLLHFSIAIMIEYFPIIGTNYFSYSCSLGFSGILFTLVAIDCFKSDWSEIIAIFGFLNIPKKIYPWILLVLIQLMITNVSFLGHLTGILVGYIYGFVWFQYNWIESFESSNYVVSFISTKKDWITFNNHSLTSRLEEINQFSISNIIIQQMKSMFSKIYEKLNKKEDENKKEVKENDKEEEEEEDKRFPGKGYVLV